MVMLVPHALHRVNKTHSIPTNSLSAISTWCNESSDLSTRSGPFPASMRMRTSVAVYEYGRQAPSGVFVLAARIIHAAGFVPIPCRILLSSRAFFRRRRSPLAPSWGRAAAAKECSSASPSRSTLGRVAVAKAPPVGRRASRSGRQARTTVYPCGTCHGPMHQLPYTHRASGTPSARAHPSNERCLRRITRRHNGGSLRPRLPHHSGGGHASLLSGLLRLRLRPRTP